VRDPKFFILGLVYFASHSSLVNFVAWFLKNKVIEWFRSEGEKR
jgi:hypothetical protein